jgi:hypothetical protein
MKREAQISHGQNWLRFLAAHLGKYRRLKPSQERWIDPCSGCGDQFLAGAVQSIYQAAVVCGR